MELYTKTKGNEKEELLRPFISHGVEVPAGFVFDGASAPRYFWSIIPPFKGTKKAACVHDYLCWKAKGKGDRLFADKLFYKMLQEADLGSIRAKIGYIGVRIGSRLGIGVRY